MIFSDYTIKQLLLDSKLNKLDTRLLLGHVLGLSRVELITRDDYQLTQAQYDNYIALYDKCLAGMPIAYILGYKEFYSRRFRVTPDTLIPRPETELLVDTVLSLANTGDKILDLGTGSGCIAISCKLENQTLDVTATDSYAEALAVAKDNAATLGAEVQFIQSDWLNGITDRYDIIVSNPPYIEPDDEHLKSLTFEPQSALTDFCDGISAIKKIIAGSVQHLSVGKLELLGNDERYRLQIVGKELNYAAPVVSNRLRSGYLLIEHRYNQGKATSDLMLSNGFKDVKTIRDYANLDRITIGKWSS